MYLLDHLLDVGRWLDRSQLANTGEMAGEDPVVLHAIRQEIVEEVARMDDPRVHERVENRVPIASGGDDALVPQVFQVPRDLGLREAQELHQLADGLLAGMKVIQDHQSSGVA